MSSAIPSASLDRLQFYSRRLLLLTPLHEPGTSSSSPASGPAISDPASLHPSAPGNSFGANMVTVLAVLLCALLCALGVNAIARCALGCSRRIGSGPEPGEAVRFATAAVRRKALRGIPVTVYSPDVELPGSGSECAICLSDLAPGARVRVLPKCSHGFHVRCIDRWLTGRPSCPTCRQCLFTVPRTVSGCGEASQTDEGTAHSIIVPLEPEPGVFTQNHSGVS